MPLSSTARMTCAMPATRGITRGLRASRRPESSRAAPARAARRPAEGMPPVLCRRRRRSARALPRTPAGPECRCRLRGRRTSGSVSVLPSGSRVPAASSVTGVPTTASMRSGALPRSPFTTTSGLWLASRHVLDRPVHARREVVLERRAPAPDRRLIRRVGLAVERRRPCRASCRGRDTNRRPASRTAASRRRTAARRSGRPSRRRSGSSRSPARCRSGRGTTACRPRECSTA